MSMIQRFERGIVVRTSLIDFCSSWTPRTTHVMKRLKQKFDWLRFIARTPAYIGYESLKGLCSRSQCRPTGHCTVMPLSTCGSLHQSPTSRRYKDFGLPPRTICAFLGNPAVRLPTVGRRAFSVAGARVWNARFADVTSAPSLFTFRKRLKLHLFPLSYPSLVL